MVAIEVEHALMSSDADLSAALLQLRESQWFERKSGQIAPKDLAPALVAFANAEGGTIAVGLSGGRVDGFSASKENDLRQAAFDFTVPPVRCRITVRETAEGNIMLFAVEPGEHVHETHRGDCFLRVGDESRKLNFLQRQELEYDRGPTPFDGTPSAAGMEDLNDELLAAYRDQLGSSTNEHALRARSLLTRDGQLTVAACLLFGSDPQLFFPQAHVRILRYVSDERGAGSKQNLASDGDIRCDGPLQVQLDRAVAEISRQMPSRRALGASGRFEDIPLIPRDAWLEGLVNAIVHRSYSNAGDHVRIEIFPSRIEITSPGRFPGLVDPNNPLNIGRHARNPRIARVFADLGITQELGEGIRRIFAEMRAQGLTDPMYEQKASVVRLVLRASDALPQAVRAELPSTALTVLDFMRRVRKPLSTGQIAEGVGSARPTVLRHLRKLQELGVVYREGNSPQDPRATWQLHE